MSHNGYSGRRASNILPLRNVGLVAGAGSIAARNYKLQ